MSLDSSDPDSVFRLTHAERESDLWRKFSAYLESRLGELRRINDHDTPEIETAWLRGRIAELKKVQDLGIPQEEEQADG